MALSEFQLIRKYFSQLTQPRDDVVLGIGDDCALLSPPAGKVLAVSMDTLVVGRHFLADVDPAALGHKSLAVNLSDLAAMGAQPAWVTLALTLPRADEQWLAGFASGFSALAEKFQLQLVGGDTTRGPLSVTIQVHGFAEPDKVLRRAGAQPGDLIYVTGQLGLAALELSLLCQGRLSWPANALERPWPRVAEGMALAGIASAAIDISDGLAADLGHICTASGTGARILCNQLPLDQRLQKHIGRTGDWSHAISGGDDYQLCFTLPPQHQQQLQQLAASQGFGFTLIGEMQPGSAVQLVLPGGKLMNPVSGGFEHFQSGG